MRILNVTQSYAPFLEFGGPPVKVRALSEALVQRGHEVTVLTADWKLAARFPGGEVPPNTSMSPFGWRRDQDGVRAIYLPTWFCHRALSWNPAVKRFARARLHNFDVVHIFGLYDLLGPAIASVCRSKNISYVVEPIGMFRPIVRSFWKKRIYHSILGARMLDGARKLIATSRQEADELVSGGIAPEKIVLRRNGVEGPPAILERNAFRAKAEIPEHAKVILFLGRLSSKKSPDLLLQAFAGLGSTLQDADAWLVMAGPDPEGMRANLARMAIRLGVGERLLFSGPIFDAEKWEAYRAADVFVLPSQNENFGNTAAEAVAAGTPVIVTENCGVAPLLAGVAGLVVPHDAAAITAALRRLLTDSVLHAKLSAGCAEVTSRLDWGEPAVAMESLYATLVAACSLMP
jgi:glycosyltransferase involved in cell wall biosynthesis